MEYISSKDYGYCAYCKEKLKRGESITGFLHDECAIKYSEELNENGK